MVLVLRVVVVHMGSDGPGIEDELGTIQTTEIWDGSGSMSLPGRVTEVEVLWRLVDCRPADIERASLVPVAITMAPVEFPVVGCPEAKDSMVAALTIDWEVAEDCIGF